MAEERSLGNNQNFDVPPSTNRGAQNTCRDGLRTLVDWVQATFTHANSVREIIDALGLKEDQFEHRQKGLYGWTESVWFEDIRIYFGGEVHPGCHLVMSGQACRQYEQNTISDWISTFRNFLSYGASFTRVDGAIDDFGVPPKRKRGDAPVKPRFKVATLIRKAKEGAITSYFDHARVIEKVKLADGESAGKTIYYGSPQSRVVMVCYEKIWERIAKGYALDHGVDEWNRFEVRMYDERAHEFIRQLVTSGKPFGDLLCGIIRQYVNYRDKVEGDSNKSRWPISRFWSNFLGEVEKLSLASAAPDRTLVRSFAWVERSVETTLGELYVAIGDEQEFLNFARRGIEKLTDENYERIARDHKKLHQHIYAQKVMELDRVRAGRLNKLHKIHYLDEEGQAIQDSIMSEVRHDFEEFNKNYSGNDYYNDLAKMRLEKFEGRRQENKNALADGNSRRAYNK